LTEWSLLESIKELDYDAVPRNRELRFSKFVGGEVVIDWFFSSTIGESPCFKHTSDIDLVDDSSNREDKAFFVFF
jgi:hypothetical protein